MLYGVEVRALCRLILSSLNCLNHVFMDLVPSDRQIEMCGWSLQRTCLHSWHCGFYHCIPCFTLHLEIYGLDAASWSLQSIHWSSVYLREISPHQKQSHVKTISIVSATFEWVCAVETFLCCYRFQETYDSIFFLSHLSSKSA